MDPTLRTRIITELKDEIAKLPPRMRAAAKYVIDHPVEFGFDPIRETARKAKVSTYTLVNMAKNLGFSSFDDLRAPFRAALLASAPTPANPTWMDDNNQSGQPGATYSEAARNALSIVQRTLESQQIDTLNAVADTLIAADTVYLTAVRSSYAMAYYLHYVGRMALPKFELIPRNMNSAIDDLNDAGPGDVLIAITITPYSRETIEACAFSRAKGLKLILISDSEIVSPELEPEYTLAANVLSTHHFACFSGMTALIETLIALLMQKGDGAALERIKSYEELRLANNAYWIAKKT